MDYEHHEITATGPESQKTWLRWYVFCSIPFSVVSMEPVHWHRRVPVLVGQPSYSGTQTTYIGKGVVSSFRQTRSTDQGDEK